MQDASSGPAGDSTNATDVPCSDKPDDKWSDKKGLDDLDLRTVVEAWPSLAEPIKSGIMAMVQASRKGE